MLYTRKCIGGSNPPLSASEATSGETTPPHRALAAIAVGTGFDPVRPRRDAPPEAPGLLRSGHLPRSLKSGIQYEGNFPAGVRHPADPESAVSIRPRPW